MSCTLHCNAPSTGSRRIVPVRSSTTYLDRYTLMLNSDMNAQACDATGDDKNDEAGKILNML